MIDRSAVNRALAKAIAYKQCGKQEEASQWAAEMVRLLECADILKTAQPAPTKGEGARHIINGKHVILRGGLWSPDPDYA